MLEKIQTSDGTRAALLYLIISNAFPGVWALFFPKTFYSSFPGFGRVWVAGDGPYNEHLIRDVGAMFLALCALAGFALLKPQLVHTRVVSICILVFNLPHLIYHLKHLHMLPVIDQIGNVVLLSMGVIVPLLLLFWGNKHNYGKASRGQPGSNPGG